MLRAIFQGLSDGIPNFGGIISPNIAAIHPDNIWFALVSGSQKPGIGFRLLAADESCPDI